MSYDCAWTFKGKIFDSEQLEKDYFCFVYLITDNKNNKMYIGQKLFRGHKYKTTKGIKKKVKCESDWKVYFSSSEAIKQIVKDEGTTNIKREILYICKSKGQANYLETKLQFDLGCLLDQNIWYNGIVNCKTHHKHIKEDTLQGSDDDLLKQLYKKYHEPILFKR